MTAIDRTAYPRPGARLTRDELGARYSLSDTDFAFIHASARGDSGRMLLATLLKTRQDLGYFATPDEIHPDTVSYLRSQMDLGIPPVSPDEERRTKTLYRYQAAVRTHLSVTTYGEAGERLIRSTTLEAAQTMSDPADLINRAIEALHAATIDLPAFRTLDRLVNRLRAEVHGRIFDLVAARLTAEHVSVLETLLIKPPNSTTTSFNRLKQAPGPATPKTIKLWIDRLDWLDGALDPDPLLEGIAHTKLRQFAAEAAALEVNDLLDISQPGKRHTLMLALLRQARMRGRDELIEMMLRRIRRTQAAAKERLEALHDEHRGIEEALIGIFGKVLETAQAQETDAAFGCQVRKLLSERGGIQALTEQCDTVSALHRDNELPLLWPIHVRYRNLLSNLTRAAFEMNYEANVYGPVSANDYAVAKAWIRRIEASSVIVSEGWLTKYVEGTRVPGGSSRSKQGAQEDQPLASLPLPRPEGLRRLVSERRDQLAAFQGHKAGLTRLFRRCADGDINSPTFYERLSNFWSGEIGDRLQGRGWEIKGMHSDFQALSESVVKIIDADDDDRDDVVAEEIDSLAEAEIPTRRAFLSEMLCLNFPDKYPLINDPVHKYLSDINVKSPRGFSEGARYIYCATMLRAALLQNPKYPAKNLAELDLAIWGQYGRPEE